MNPFHETLIRISDAERADEIQSLQLSDEGGPGPTSESVLLRFATVARGQGRLWPLRRLAATMAERIRRRPPPVAEPPPSAPALPEIPAIKPG